MIIKNDFIASNGNFLRPIIGARTAERIEVRRLDDFAFDGVLSQQPHRRSRHMKKASKTPEIWPAILVPGVSFAIPARRGSGCSLYPLSWRQDVQAMGLFVYLLL